MRKILCIVLALGICAFSLFAYAQDNTDLQTQQQELQGQIQNANDELEDVQIDLSENLQQVQKLDEKITNSQSELEKLNKKIEELTVSINNIEIELKVVEEKYQKQKKIFENRLITMYEAGDTEYLDVILSSKNISDFLSNYFLITEIATYDAELLDDMKQKKDDIDLKKEKLEKSRKELSTIKQTQTKTSIILQNTKTLRENYISKLSDQEKELQEQIEEYTARYAEINAQILQLAMQGIDTQYIGGELAWPVPGYTKITSKYGMRYHPILHINKLHTGVDISAPMGANFISANDGIVTKAGLNTAYGNMVIIDHGGGISTLYAHGSEILVQVGQTVKRGDPVLKVGSTGYSTGAHAHFEVRINGVVTDPMPYITNGIIPTTQTNTENNSTTTENTNN